MTLPLSPNTTCDIYEPGNSPPAAPDAEAVRCYLKPAYARGLEAGNESDAGEMASKFTHMLLLDAGVTDAEDGHDASAFTAANSSTVYIPDKDGTQFLVVFVQRQHAGTPHDHKCLYLRRQTVTWPTDEL